MYSTDSAKTTRFKPHGRVTIDIYDEGIVLYQAIGPFNRELIEIIEKIELEAILEYKEKFTHWCELIVFQKSCFMMPDALAEFERYLCQLKQRDLVPCGSAYVFHENIEAANLMKKSYRNAYQNAGIAYEDFSTFDEALLWAREQLK